jgi:hypothetical protein
MDRLLFLESVKAEALRFICNINAAIDAEKGITKQKYNTGGTYTVHPDGYTIHIAAARRSSMDLSRILTLLRKPI